MITFTNAFEQSKCSNVHISPTTISVRHSSPKRITNPPHKSPSIKFGILIDNSIGFSKIENSTKNRQLDSNYILNDKWIQLVTHLRSICNFRLCCNVGAAIVVVEQEKCRQNVCIAHVNCFEFWNRPIWNWFAILFEFESHSVCVCNFWFICIFDQSIIVWRCQLFQFEHQTSDFV